MDFNFLSGSTVDNYHNFLFDVFKSGKAYLGFARNKPIWGLQCLCMIDLPKFQTGVDGSIIQSSFTDHIVGVPGGSMERFFDLKNVQMDPAILDLHREVFFCYTEGKADFDFGPDGDEFILIDNNVIASGGDGKLYMNHMNKEWCYVQNLSPKYYEMIKKEVNVDRKYYLLNYMKDTSKAVKISDKFYTDLPFYVFDVKLAFFEVGKESTTKKYISPATNLKKIMSILGETKIIGLSDSCIQDLMNQNPGMWATELDLKRYMLSNDVTFQIEDLDGNILIPNMTYANRMNTESSTNSRIFVEGQMEKFLVFSYHNPNGEEVFLKVNVTSNEVGDLGMWHESLPFRSANPVDDSNPPALDISYLKNPLLSSSMFDVLGLSRIDFDSEVEFVREMKSLSEKNRFISYGFQVTETILHGTESSHVCELKSTAIAGSTVISLKDGQNFVVGDLVTIDGTTYTVMDVNYTLSNNSITLNYPLSRDLLWVPDRILSSKKTNVIARINYAVTKDYDAAIKYGFNSVRVKKNVDGSNLAGSPTDKVYRQLFICYKPKRRDPFTGNIEECSGNVHLEDELFLTDFHRWDVGMVVYLSNKIPVYRRYIEGQELFEIIV